MSPLIFKPAPLVPNPDGGKFPALLLASIPVLFALLAILFSFLSDEGTVE